MWTRKDIEWDQELRVKVNMKAHLKANMTAMRMERDVNY